MGILAAKKRPEAIVGGNDYIAMGIMDAAKKLKLSIPEDIAVVGFDNTEFATRVAALLGLEGFPKLADSRQN